jgi:hypothetical protein
MKTDMDCPIIRGVADATRIEGASPCPRCHHTSLRAHLGAVRRPVARQGSGPSARLPPSAHTRPSCLREVGRGPSVRLRLLADRRRGVFGHHHKAQARRVDGGRGDGRPGGDGALVLRPGHRPRAFRRVDRRVHTEIPPRRREIGQKPCGSREAGYQALHCGGRGRHPPGRGRGRGKAATTRRFWPHPDAVEDSVGLPEDARVHFERAYDSKKTRRLLEERGLVGVVNQKGDPRR